MDHPKCFFFWLSIEILFEYTHNFMQLSYCLTTTLQVIGFIKWSDLFTCKEHMLPGLCPLYQITVHHFLDLLMDGENLITQSQAVKVWLVSQILNSTQALLHQIFDVCSCFILFTESFVDKIKFSHSVFVPFVSGLLKLFNG